jgi:hypothetical protein
MFVLRHFKLSYKRSHPKHNRTIFAECRSLQHSIYRHWARIVLTAIRHGVFVYDHGGIVHCPVHKDDARISGL